ncbi:MAG: hypothetical protein ACOC2U_03790 [bacterium]
MSYITAKYLRNIQNVKERAMEIADNILEKCERSAIDAPLLRETLIKMDQSVVGCVDFEKITTVNSIEEDSIINAVCAILKIRGFEYHIYTSDTSGCRKITKIKVSWYPENYENIPKHS